MDAAKPGFCTFCGNPFAESTPDGRHLGCLICTVCNNFAYHGPQMLVLSLVFSQGRLLLMKRGLPPYVGRWAPPGGFVEPHESAEAAAVREIAEEVGIQLNSEQLVPHAIISLPAINQIYVCFLAVLDRMPLPQACAPESLDARWFTLEEYPRHSIWDPGIEFDAERIFKEVQTGQLHFYQCTGDSSRVFGPYVRRT